MTIKIYHNPRCSKSRQTLQLLHDKGFEPEVVEYLKSPPTKKELAEIALKLPDGATRMVRAKDAKDLGFDPKDLTHEEIINLLDEDPSVMERPIVVTDKGARLGRPPEDVLEIL